MFTVAFIDHESHNKHLNFPLHLHETIDHRVAPPLRDLCVNLETYQVEAHFEALDEGALLVRLDRRYPQVGFNLVIVQV